MARDSGRPTAELVEAFRSSGRVDELRAHLRHRKVKETLRRGASLVEEAPPKGKAKAEDEDDGGKKKRKK
jgi:hypothetical protein